MLKSSNVVFLVFALLTSAFLVSGCSFRNSSEVFFSGTDKLLVCEKPYLEKSDCSELNVKNVDDEKFIIYFENEKVEIDDIFCSTNDDGNKVCQGKDAERTLYDIYKTDAVF